MVRLSEHLRYLIAKRVEEDPAWRSVQIIFSGPEVPGEGEHKIMEWIRAERANPDHEPNLRHCLYGLDADLIMLGLLSHEPHFSLLREEVTFGRKKGSSGTKNADQVRFYLLHLGLIREYLEAEFAVLKGQLESFDFERILDDFVLLSLFVGNDFLPHLPHLHINENALGLLFDAYKTTRPHLDGYLNDGGRVNMNRCVAVLENIAYYEKDMFESECADELKAFSATKMHASSSNLPPITPKQQRLFADFVDNFLRKDNVDTWTVGPEVLADHPEDRIFVAGLAKDFFLILTFTEDHKYMLKKQLDPSDSDYDEEEEEQRWELSLPLVRTIAKYEKRPISSDLNAEAMLEHEDALYAQWKNRYYSSKMEIREESQLNALLGKYCEGLEWVMAYYYEGVASWGWFFPYHYAPFLSDIVQFLRKQPYQCTKFELGTPFRPMEQLMGVLPNLSSALVPAPLATLMTAPESPILHFFPTEYESDLNGKKNAWEAVVKIPFIDEKLLLATVQPRYALMTAAERMRNEFGTPATFTSGNAQLRTIPAPSATFEPLQDTHVAIVPLSNMKAPSRAELRLGLTPGVRMGTEGPSGFPTLGTLAYSGILQHLNVTVFSSQPSKNLTMSLMVTPSKEVAVAEADPMRFIRNCNGRVFINWPYLLEAELAAICDGQRVYSASSCIELTPEMVSAWCGGRTRDWHRVTEDLEGQHSRQKGILLSGGVGAVAAVFPFRKFVYNAANGSITKEFARDQPVVLVPLHLVVTSAGLAEQIPTANQLALQERPSMAGATAERVAQAFSVDPEQEERHVVLYAGPRGELFGRLARVVGFASQGRALMLDFGMGGMKKSVRTSHVVMAGENAASAKIIADDASSRARGFVSANDCAREANVPAWLLSKLLSVMQLTQGGGSLLNVGLGVKFEGRSLAVPRYARRPAPGRWEYSREVVAVMQGYERAFPELFAGMRKLGAGGLDRVSLEDVLRAAGYAGRADKAGLTAYANRVRDWLKERSFPGTDDALPCAGTAILGKASIAALVKASDQCGLVASLSQLGVAAAEAPVGPISPEHCVRRNEATLFAASLGTAAKFSVGDRIVHVGDGADGVPFGATGIAVGVIGSGGADGAVLAVMDAALRGIGSDLNGLLPKELCHRGLRLSSSKALNVDHPPIAVRRPEKKAARAGAPMVQQFTSKAASRSFSDMAVNSKPKAAPAALPVVRPVEVKRPEAKALLQQIFTAAASQAQAAPAEPAIKAASTVGTVKLSYSTKTKTLSQK